MHEKMAKLKKYALAAICLQIIILAVFRIGLDKGIMTASIIIIFESVFLYYVFDRFESLSQAQSEGVSDILGKDAKEAYLFGQTGMVIYDDSYVITWMSDLFQTRGIDRIGKKVLTWLPEADDLISGKAETVTVQLDDRVYEIKRNEDAPILFFRDITELNNYRLAYQEEQVVIGMINLDNYEESTEYEDEAVVASINTAVRTPVTDYCREHGILVKRINNYRYQMVLNEKIFSDLVADHFSVLTKVRKAAQKLDVTITVSMAFARGTDQFDQLDEMTANLMDLAQSRGGDQVAIQKMGEEVKYYGGSTEALEKRSRVRVRVMAHTVRDLLQRSGNVIICCHREADFDCMGSAIAFARMAQTLHREAVIIARTGGIEEKLAACMSRYKDELKEEVRLVTENEALNQLRNDTLVVMVDHHSANQSNGAQVLEKARRVIMIDHHRRGADMGVMPELVYIEAGASSTSELITEMIPYVSSQIELSELDATIMLTGMTIDTNRFRVRTGARTYDAASTLRKWGADPLLADELLKDSYGEFAEKTAVMALSQRYEHGIIITPVKNRTLTRSMMSQAADSLLEIQGVEAAFVIANDEEGETAISARSNGRINVQVIMENMHGGGHMTAAALQREKCSIDDLQKELKATIDEYFKEAEPDEGNTEK